MQVMCLSLGTYVARGTSIAKDAILLGFVIQTDATDMVWGASAGECF